MSHPAAEMMQSWQLDLARARLRRERPARLRAVTQARIDVRAEHAAAVGRLDLLVLLPSGRVARLFHAGLPLLPAFLTEGPRGATRTGRVALYADWVRFSTPDGWSVVGLIVDRA